MKKAKKIATLTHRQLEDVLLEWINYAVAELRIESFKSNLAGYLDSIS